MSSHEEQSAEALVSSGRVEAQIAYLDPNNTLSFKYLASQSLGRGFIPSLPSPDPWLGKLLASQLHSQTSLTLNF